MGLSFCGVAPKLDPTSMVDVNDVLGVDCLKILSVPVFGAAAAAAANPPALAKDAKPPLEPLRALDDALNADGVEPPMPKAFGALSAEGCPKAVPVLAGVVEDATQGDRADPNPPALPKAGALFACPIGVAEPKAGALLACPMGVADPKAGVLLACPSDVADPNAGALFAWPKGVADPNAG